MSVPVYTIYTPQLVVRCWQPQDAGLLKDAVDTSINHLLPWLPWAKNDPQTVDEKIELLRLFRGRFDLGQDFIYGIFDAGQTRALGGTGLHPRHAPGEREIGYWMRRDSVGQGLGTEATMAMVKTGFAYLNLHRIEIRCDPRNAASAAIPGRLGFTHEATLPRRNAPMFDQPHDIMVWSLFSDQYPHTPSAGLDMHACDAAGREIFVNDKTPGSSP